MTLEQDKKPLGKRAVRGAAISGVAQGVKLVVQIVSVIALSRMLSPADFGLVAMATPVISFAKMAQSFGLGQAVIVSRDLTDAQASTMFWINAILSLAIGVLLALCSPLIADFYREPRLLPIVAVLSVGVFASGLSAQHTAMANRSLRYGGMAAVEIAIAVLGLAVSIIWALRDPSPWALIAGTVMGSFVAVVGAWMISGWRPGRPSHWRTVIDLLRFGGGMTTFNLTNFFARSLDNILIGRVHGPQALGLYDRAYKLLLFPLQQVTYPLQRVMVPTLSRLLDEPDRYRSAYSRTVSQVMLLAIPGILFLIVYADAAIPILLGPQWVDTVDIFRWLAIAAVHQPLTVTLGWLFISQRRAGEFGKWGIFNAVSCAVAFCIGLPWGPEGVAAAYALSDVFLRLPLVWRQVGSKGPVSAADLRALALPFLASGAIATLLMWVARPLFIGSVVGIIAAVAALYAIVIACLLAVPPGRAVIGSSVTMLRLLTSRA